MDKSSSTTTSKNHPLILDSSPHVPTTLFDFVRLYGYIPSPPDTQIDNAYKEPDCPPPRPTEPSRELVDSTRFPWPPSPSRAITPSSFHLCPSCGHSPLGYNTTPTTSYYTPRVMSDASFNPSVKSPMDDTTAWDTTDALPIPPPISSTTYRAVALAPAVSPRSALAILDSNDDIDPDALRAIARGLTVTLQQRDAYDAQQRRRNEQRIKDLEKRIGVYEEVFDSVPQGYKENNGRIPHLAIPVGEGRYKGAKYIKQLEGGWVAGVTDEDGPNSTPHIAELFASPAYDINDTTNDPAQPMPPWFRRILFGHAALFSTMQKAILDLDDWGLYAEVSRHRAYDVELGTILG